VTAAPAAVWVVTGISASGKTTVARLLADRLDPSALIEGDALRTMVRNGRAEMSRELRAAAVKQLELRYRHAALLADSFAAHGFHTVVEDVLLGPSLETFVTMLGARPLHVVVLAPAAAVVVAREATRAKTGYGDRWTVDELDRGLRKETARVGLWLDTSAQTPEETVDEILRRGDASVVAGA
jgi:chloramphenicol 3-O-phosphotransferase